MNKDRWLELMQQLGFKANLETYLELTCCYDEKHRYYHNAKHIKATLDHLQQAKDFTQDYTAIEIALWFHDAVYSVFSSKNEIKSANWATRFLSNNNAKDEFVEKVHRLIMATLHNYEPVENDEKIIMDVDLSILGSSSELYKKYEHWIRKEYKFIPCIIYRKSRRRILQGFLSRERIYATDYFFDKFEKQARRNLDNVINNL